MARTFTSCARSQRSRPIVSTVPPTTIVPTAALLSTTSSRPNARTALATTAAQASGRARSAPTDSTSPPAARTSSTVRASSGARASASATRAPARAKSSALARPMPVAAPVMMATLPFSAPLSAMPMVSSPRSVGVLYSRTPGDPVVHERGDGLFPPAAYARDDESRDDHFYRVPRKVVHIDDGALAALGHLYAEVMPADGRLLDLMSSWRSHLPAEFRAGEVVGLGMNADEMADNPRLSRFVVHDLNAQPRLPAAAGKEWHGFRHEPGEGVGVVAGGGKRSAFASPKVRFTTEERLKDMDAQGVDMQVVSIHTPLFGYHLDPAQGRQLAREVNDEIASMTRERPQRFAGLATLPVQDVKAAIDELERAVTVLGLKGAELDTMVNGENWDEPKFLPLFKAAESLGAVLIFHPQPQHNFMMTLTTRHGFFNSLGVIMEDAIVVAMLIFGGVLDACPDLKVCIAHGGGPACLAMGRIDRSWRGRTDARE